jgi:adenosylcobinamide-GDP ribazoletransferase
MLLLIFAFPVAGSGLGHRVKQHCRLPQMLLGTAVAVSAAWLLLGVRGLVMLAAAALVAAAAGLMFRSQLSGCTGDSYGAACEVTEVAVLAVSAALVNMRMPW